MSSWRAFVDDASDFGTEIESIWRAYKHHTMATIRADGSPRISGTEVVFENGELLLGMMPGTRRSHDLRRDPRIALHSHSVDPPDDDPGSWVGEAKIIGRAFEIETEDPVEEERFRIDIAQVVRTRVGIPADHLDIDTWTPERGRLTLRR
jgi:Pyridoxamine 5'-phosphate oxidase